MMIFGPFFEPKNERTDIGEEIDSINKKELEAGSSKLPALINIKPVLTKEEAKNTMVFDPFQSHGKKMMRPLYDYFKSTISELYTESLNSLKYNKNESNAQNAYNIRATQIELLKELNKQLDELKDPVDIKKHIRAFLDERDKEVKLIDDMYKVAASFWGNVRRELNERLYIQPKRAAEAYRKNPYETQTNYIDKIIEDMAEDNQTYKVNQLELNKERDALASPDVPEQFESPTGSYKAP